MQRIYSLRKSGAYYYYLLLKCEVAKLGSKAGYFLSGKREGGGRERETERKRDRQIQRKRKYEIKRVNERELIIKITGNAMLPD